MKIPFSWIKEFTTVSLNATECAEVLTAAGIEVDSMTKLTLAADKVVVAEVRGCVPHPDAERLRVATVFDGAQTHQVVCGAPNCREGIRVAMAQVGALFTETDGSTFKIKKSKIRGVESQGMLCSAKELGLGEEHDGILELSADYSLGSSLLDYYQDVVFEISLTPNLNHCSSVRGIARELASLIGTHCHLPHFTLQQTGGPSLK